MIHFDSMDIVEVTDYVMFNLLNVLINPVLIYGSDVWGLRSELWGTIGMK